MPDTFQDPYVLPGTTVLRNRFNIPDQARLDVAERQFVTARALGKIPAGDFDLHHLRAIHRYLFQDVYAWAGEIRTVDISKGDSVFQSWPFIETGMGHVHNMVRGNNYFVGLTAENYAAKAVVVLSDLNYCHPFREGNGRTQLEYFRQLTDRAGHVFRREFLDPKDWITASRMAMAGNNQGMIEQILRTLLGA